ncbi:hypothetical protein [Aquimonas voraii]|uniref:Uncharacterized protein n=1 Tax=Aquimonas voraii TaxID=265719 RepID=A0A1G6VYX6_9GAMM|nr:hypothetical protein [Aquimonas voraii]SDD58920.1 hypothetical protein SAMN04488509_10438 [Aquimonas voraii]
MNCKRSFFRRALALCITPLACTAGPSVPGSAASLTAEYEINGAGTWNSRDGVLAREWRVADRYALTVRMQARAASGFAALHGMAAGQQAAEGQRNAAAMRAAQNMAPMMDDAMKIAERCGEDEACLMRETMKMAEGIDMNSAAVRGARADVAVASRAPADRYQVFEPLTVSGRFEIDEFLKEADRDPICAGRPAASCHRQVTLRQSGEITLEGKANPPGGSVVEVDLEGGSLRFALPLPYPVAVQESVTSDKPGSFSGEREAHRFLTDQRLDLDITHACGDGCRSARGSRSYEIVDQISGQPARLTVNWRFQRE